MIAACICIEYSSSAKIHLTALRKNKIHRTKRLNSKIKFQHRHLHAKSG